MELSPKVIPATDNLKQADVIVVGSGIAGLSFSLRMAERGKRVIILTKKDKAESNTNYAQGGIACVTSEGDAVELHVKDTLIAGDGLCNEEVVRTIVKEGPARIQELIAVGVEFSQLDDGRISLHREGGHSKRRILHVRDLTGRAIEEALLHAVAQSPLITMCEHFLAVDLITRHKLERCGQNRDRVLGLYALDVRSGRVETIQAPVVMLATGGAGQVYLYTTNPEIATGDGIAMAYRAGAEIRNMEFIQFHPTALYSATGERFLISEAVRGEGAILRNTNQEAFMKRYDARGDLAPRDIVARAIDAEMKKAGARYLWLDITHKPEEELREKFPGIWAACERNGINMARDPIPVVPAAHYLCGGVTATLDAQTTLAGLYACGEVACTGLHGANRLASNSLLEAVVIAHRAATAVNTFIDNHSPELVMLPAWVDGNAHDSDERVVLLHNWDELKRTLWDYVGIVRTKKRLERARARIEQLRKEIHEYYWNFKVEPRLLELRNLAEVALMIIECALQRHESRGLHFTLDYPNKLTEAQDSVIRKSVY
ncbi:MAG: L-aspartate oxidase [Verrucomicrobiota bacterium]|nr:L-aspartate oxidase [Verrucomicrobiota bacterium]